MYRTLTQVRNNLWEADNGDYIVKDEFGYKICVNGWFEHTSTLEKAIAIINDPRYY